MIFPVPPRFVISQPVPTLVPRRRVSRELYRRNRYGKQDVFSKIRGELSPKQMREAGL